MFTTFFDGDLNVPPLGYIIVTGQSMGGDTMKKHGRGGDETPEISSEGIKPAKSKRKRAAAIIVSVILSVGILSGAGLWFISRGQAGGDNVVGGTSDTKKVVGMYGSTSSYLHYPIDDELDVTTVDEYMELDRTVHYKENGESIALDDDNIDMFGDDVKFFVMYFYYIVTGDFETYNKQFTEDYYKSAEPYYSFTQQMLYDIEIEKLGEDKTESETRYRYDVSYKIFRNNGTFRNDIGSDASKTLYFELTKSGGKVLIDKIDYYR